MVTTDIWANSASRIDEAALASNASGVLPLPKSGRRSAPAPSSSSRRSGGRERLRRSGLRDITRTRRLERLQYGGSVLRTDQLRSAWFEPTSNASRRDLADRIQQRAFESVPYIPTAESIVRGAFRKTLADVINAPIAFLWNIENRE
jgi:hypothetical protein